MYKNKFLNFRTFGILRNRTSDYYITNFESENKTFSVEIYITYVTEFTKYRKYDDLSSLLIDILEWLSRNNHVCKNFGSSSTIVKRF